jgi:enamine deaminase RidA (YjgF/YER057c/UK114 family)
MSRDPIEVGKPWERTIPFSLGVVTEGRLLHTAGITARDPDGALVGVGDMRAQIDQCFTNARDVLRAAGAGFEDVVKWTMYTTDIDAFSRASDLWHPHFVDRPASTLVEVRRLVHPDMLVEIEAVVILK